MASSSSSDDVLMMEVDSSHKVESMMDDNNNNNKIPALVFGASGVQGHAVIEGLMSTGCYDPVYGVTRNVKDSYLTDVLGATLYQANVGSQQDVRQVLISTQAQVIFFVTTTEMPTGIGMTSGFCKAQQEEYNVIVGFFESLITVHQQYDQKNQLKRHVVLSTFDNVEKINQDIYDMTNQTWITPLDDGSIVAHYSGKGRAGEVATKLLDPIDGLSLTLLTLPFLHGNFLGFFTPLPNEGATQWTISACFGDDSKIDMLSESDLAYIVPQIFSSPTIYNGKNIRLSAEQISMEDVAAMFSDLFGKDVIYNPLTVQEMAVLPIPAAGSMAQMCQFLADPKSLAHNVELTEAVMYPKPPQLFKDWLLVHSDSTAFDKVGLSVDGADIVSVTVFGATGRQGTSVVKGLLADPRKQYTIRATTRHVDSDKAKAIKALDSTDNRVTIVYADYDKVDTCKAAVEGMDGAFLVTDFFGGAAMDAEVEERHAKNVIDACEAAHSVRHLVFSTMESVEEMNKKMGLGMKDITDAKGKKGTLPQFDAKARAAAYARTKRLSVTYVLMPCYSEMFFDLLKPEKRTSESGQEKLVMTVPMKDGTKVGCMSVEDLGPAVANIFDSYQCYAGHEIGLVTDFVTMKEAADIITEVFAEEAKAGDSVEVNEIEQQDVGMDQWVEARDTYMKDLGQMFSYMAHTDAVKKRRDIAKTLNLVPSARPLRLWVEQNKDNAAFREKLGLR